MPENTEPRQAIGSNVFKEAVCVDTHRIYDSCRDKDCVEDMRVIFTNSAQAVIDAAYTVKAKRAEVLHTYFDTEPVPFNKGFYSVDMTFFFHVTFEAFTSPVGRPVKVDGLASYTKKVILYGSEGNAKTFTSRDTVENPISRALSPDHRLPKAIVHIAEPMILDTKLKDTDQYKSDFSMTVPVAVARLFDGDFCRVSPEKSVEITLGLFTIVQLERAVQIMIPAYDFCIPDKECSGTTETPSEIFNRIKFPADDFFPPKMNAD
ncbi:MAG: hypothetical protein FWH14_07340 [Oscillospiraceae bacterium]|nr:hypothetical protein [Oscillospiraceae bacterium]